MSNALNIALVLSAIGGGAVQSSLGGVQKTLVKLGDVTKELTDRQKRLGSTIKDLALNSPHLKSMQDRYRQLGSAIDVVTSKQKRLNDLIKQGAAIKQQRDGYKSSLFETAGQTAAIGAPVLKSVQLAGGFQDALRDISITGELTKVEEKQLGSSIRANALKFNQTQEDLSKGIGVLVAGGISSVKDLTTFAPILAKAATATRANVDELGAVFIAMRDNLNISAKDSESALNMLAYAGKKGQFEIKDMAKWLPSLAPQMAALGLTGKEAVAEIGAALQVARKGAGTNDEAANNFRNFLAKVTSPDSIKDFAKAGIDLKGDLVKLRAEGMTPMQGMLQLITQYMGSKGPEAAGQFTKALATKDDVEREAAISRLKEAYKLGELFQDMQAMNFIKPAIANAKELKDIKQGAMDAGGTDLLGADLGKRMEGFNERWKGFTIHLKELGISLGNTLLPPLTAALSVLAPIIGFVGKLVNTFPRLTGALVGIVSGLMLGKMALLGFLYLKTMVSGFFLSVQTAAALASAKLAIFRVQSMLAGVAVKSSIGTAIAATKLWIVTQYQSLTASLAARGGVIGLSKSFAGSMVSGIRSAIVAVRAFSLSLLSSPIGWIGLAVGAAAFLIYKYWKPLSGFFTGLWSGLKEGLKGLEPAWNVFKKVAPLFMPIIIPIKWLFNAIKALFKPVDDVGGAAQNMGLRFGKAIGGTISSVLQFAGSWRKLLNLFLWVNPITAPLMLMNKLVKSIFGINLFAAGANIFKTLVAGMKSMFNAPAAVMKSLVQKIRNFLPFSPAKEGPLKDIHRIRLIETIAETMKPAPMVKAMRTVTAATLLATAVTAPPVHAFKAVCHTTAATSSRAAAYDTQTSYNPKAANNQKQASTITFAPVINITAAAGANSADIKGQVNQALKLSQAEFEKMLRRAEQDKQRKGFV